MRIGGGGKRPPCEREFSWGLTILLLVALILILCIPEFLKW